MLDLGPRLAIYQVIGAVLLVLHQLELAFERRVEVILDVVVRPPRQQLSNF